MLMGFAALGLRVGDHMETDGGLASRFGPEDLDDPPGGKSADPQRQVERQRTGADHRHVGAGRPGVPETHDRTLAELLLNLADRNRQTLLLIDDFGFLLCHSVLLFLILNCFPLSVA